MRVDLVELNLTFDLGVMVIISVSDKCSCDLWFQLLLNSSCSVFNERNTT